MIKKITIKRKNKNEVIKEFHNCSCEQEGNIKIITEEGAKYSYPIEWFDVIETNLKQINS